MSAGSRSRRSLAKTDRAVLCVFCGKGRRTNEHIFAEWIDKLYPEAAQERSPSYFSMPDGSTKKILSRPFEQQVKIVCAKRCNNGWMSKLETAVGPILGPMVRDAHQTTLTPPLQRLIAKWAIKTAFVLQYVHPTQRVVPDAEYHKFYLAEEPGDSYIVGIAHRANLIDDDTGIPHLFSSIQSVVGRFAYEPTMSYADVQSMHDAGATMFRLTFTLGHVAFVVFGHTFPKLVRLQRSPELHKLLLNVWPMQERFQWPPIFPIEEAGGLAALHNVFNWPQQLPP